MTVHVNLFALGGHVQDAWIDAIETQYRDLRARTLLRQTLLNSNRQSLASHIEPKVKLLLKPRHNSSSLFKLKPRKRRSSRKLLLTALRNPPSSRMQGRSAWI